jgi:flagellar protein FliO/FliZ
MAVEEILLSLASLVFVVALIYLFAFMAKKLNVSSNLNNIKSKAERRLKIVEILPIDAKRKLVLFEKDNEEILISCGEGGDLLISRDKHKEDKVEG